MARKVTIGEKDSATFTDASGKAHKYTPCYVTRETDGRTIEVCAMSSQPIERSRHSEVVSGFRYGTESKAFALKFGVERKLRGLELRNVVRADYLLRAKVTTIAGMKRCIPGFTTQSEKEDKLAGLREAMIKAEAEEKAASKK